MTIRNQILYKASDCIYHISEQTSDKIICLLAVLSHYSRCCLETTTLYIMCHGALIPILDRANIKPAIMFPTTLGQIMSPVLDLPRGELE